MANYELIYKKSVSKDLRRIPSKDVARIINRIEKLREDPRPVGCEKLSGQEQYRIRQGVYRIVYSIADRQLSVTVVAVGHRRDVYERR